MRTLVIGRNGQLGRELERSAPAEGDCLAVGRPELDVRDAAVTLAAVKKIAPQVIINTAAYTAVDRAEEEAELAYAVNARGAEHVARAAKSIGAHLIHISTDFVFDGLLSRPYRPEDQPNPVSVYGASKLAGERHVQEILQEHCTVVRTSWLYSVHGSNFVKTMLRLMGERDRLRVVADQVGTPTWAGELAEMLWKLAGRPLPGVYHLSDAGVASWYDFAVAIAEEALAIGILTQPLFIEPIRTAEYPTPARRPPYSVLDKTELWQAVGSISNHWRVNLRKMLHEMTGGRHG